MQIQGATPAQGPQGNRPAAKAAPKEGGKSFGAAFDKAVSAQSGGAPSAPVHAPAPAPAPAPASSAAPAASSTEAPAGGDHMDTIRFRLKTGYYNSKSIDDALSDKLSGYFDELA